MANSRIRRTNNFSSYVAALNKDVQALQAQANNITGVADGSISGSSLSTTTELGTNTIQSSNYAEGLTGWKIDGTGVAEFSDVYVRGDINAYSGTIGYWNISSPGVERNIGGKRLYGTFIESENLGDTDTNDSTGIYVGLYRSYRETDVVVSGAYRKDNIAIIMSPGHGYSNGDKVTVSVTGTATYVTADLLVVNKARASNTVTLLTSEFHPYKPGDTLVISGVDTELDGTYTALSGTIDKTIIYTKSGTNISSAAVDSSTALVHRSVSQTGFGFSTGPAYVTIIQSDYASFRYENTGEDIDPIYEGSFTGTALMYDENVAGLYLNDYSKALFDNGYFSNQGIGYVSAETYNLVHNPSFEYWTSVQDPDTGVITSTLTTSVAGWTVDTGLTGDSIVGDLTKKTPGTANILDKYIAKSANGLVVEWGTETYTDKYAQGTVNYSLAESAIKYGRTLYFNADIFANPFGTEITPTAFTLGNNGSTITVDSVAHGLLVGDYVLSVHVVNTETNPALPAVYETDSNENHGHLVEYIDVKNGLWNRVVKVTAATEDTFTVAVSGRPNSATLSATGQRIYKINIPVFNLSDVRIMFPNGGTAGLADIIDDTTKALWATETSTGTYKYKNLTLSRSDIDEAFYINMGTGVREDLQLPPLSVISESLAKNNTSMEYTRIPYVIGVNSARLYQKYKDLDPTSLGSKSNFSILFPGWLNTKEGRRATTKYSLDSVMIASQKKYFYAGSKYSTQTWLDSTLAPNTASIQGSKTWIDVNLENQTSNINYLDSLTFSYPSFSDVLYAAPGIYNDNSLDPSIILYGLHDDDSTGTQFASGIYQQTLPGVTLQSRPTRAAVMAMSSDLITSTSPYSTYTQLTSWTQWLDNSEVVSTYAASIGLQSTQEASDITISADSVSFNNINSYGMAEGNRAPISVDFQGQVTIDARIYANNFDVVSIIRSAPTSGVATSTWVVTLAETYATTLDLRVAIFGGATQTSSIIELNETSLAALNGKVFNIAAVTDSLNTIELYTINADVADLLDTDLSSSGGWMYSFTDTHPMINNSNLGVTDNSERIPTTAWVQSVLAGYTPGGGATPVAAASTENLIGTYENGTSGVGATFTLTANGVFTLDGVDTLVVGDLVLLKDQTTQTQNGVYTITTIGTSSSVAVLTRSDEYDNSPDGPIANGDAFSVTAGDVNADDTFINTTTADPIVLGTSEILFTLETTGASYTFEAPLLNTSGVVSLSTGYVYNTDSSDYVKLFAGAAAPTGAVNGDVWVSIV